MYVNYKDNSVLSAINGSFMWIMITMASCKGVFLDQPRFYGYIYIAHPPKLCRGHPDVFITEIRQNPFKSFVVN